MKRQLLLGSATLAVIGLISGCTQAPPKVDNPVSISQGVQVSLAPDASITQIVSDAVFVGQDGQMSSEHKDMDADLVEDLPIRVSTTYRTDDGSTGTNLKDLAGYTGKVDIELNVQNLTVRSQDVSYDVAGQSKTDPALVGAPLTVMASAQLPGVRVDQLASGDDQSETGTNGVISTSTGNTAKETNGQSTTTVVQWASLLAPPVSPAQTTMRLSGDVENFVVPTFDIAVQPGLNTDLSSTGALTTGAKSNGSNELEMQERTIDVVMSVNDVLARAGKTMTDVRDNLETTSGTLGVEAAESLKNNSKSLTKTMESVQKQVDQLGEDLAANTESASEETNGQLSEVVAAMDSMLGDTSAAPAPAYVEGETCGAEVHSADQNYSVYSSLAQISAQLDGYAKATTECRDSLSQALADSIGPSEPTAENCDNPSMTCAFRESSMKITEELIGLVVNGEKLIADLQPEIIGNTMTLHKDLVQSLEESRKDLDNLHGQPGGNIKPEDLEKLKESVGSSQDQLSKMTDSLNTLHDLAEKNIERIGEANKASSMQGQNQQLIDEICELATDSDENRGITKSEAKKLLAHLTDDADCLDDQPVGPTATAGPPDVEPSDEPSPTEEADPSPVTPTHVPLEQESATPSEIPKPSNSVKPSEAPSSSPSPSESPTESKLNIADPAAYVKTDPSELPLPTGRIPEEEATPTEPSDDERPPLAQIPEDDKDEEQPPLAEIPENDQDEEQPPLAEIPEDDQDEELSAPMDVQLSRQSQDWAIVLDASDTSNKKDGAGRDLTDLSQQLDELYKQLENLTEDDESQTTPGKKALEDLDAEFAKSMEANTKLGESLKELDLQQKALEAQIRDAFAQAAVESSVSASQLINNQVRVVSEQGNLSREAVVEAFNHSVAGLLATSDDVKADSKKNVDQQHAELQKQAEALGQGMDEQTAGALESIAQASGNSARDIDGAKALLSASLDKVILDLGNRKVNGSGLLGSLSTSAALSETADYQLALASKTAEEYANLREEDISAIMHRQAQIKASMQASIELPAFGIEVPQGAQSNTLYSFRLEGNS
ncbi:hypothetical protein NMP99_01200 [Glutamicibacter mishrai]|uniref:hypothetical protein n=1 Tax=Glutamicibacter mishrai TaxID=1775880 RepID=UPI0020CCB1E9|nr:hypothetical protein [Glutamicibacter mishrai]UTT39958.1 hypothetical protein NMP99_01200 [Glutamicibacter mishrai]